LSNKINQQERAAIAWEILTRIAKNKQKIRYGELARQIGIHHRVVRFVLGLIQNYCLANQLQPLTILVVNQSGLPGDGFIAWDVDDIDEGFKRVYNENWNNHENPFGYAKAGLTEDEIIEKLLANPDRAKDVYAKIKVRGTAQPIFRKVLLQAYEQECAFCHFSLEVALQASHIIPWSEATRNERLDVRNGLLLCATHHKLFDNGWLTVNEDYTIKYCDPKENGGRYSEYDNLLATALHNKKLKLPKNKKHWPSKKYLKKHSLAHT